MGGFANILCTQAIINKDKLNFNHLKSSKISLFIL